MSSVSNLTAVRAMISDAPREELQILTRGLCEELELVKSQLGWIIEEEANAEAVAQALRKELDATKAELGATKAELGATKAKLDAAEEEGFELETELHDLLQEALADKAAADEAAAEAAAALGKLQKELGACKAELGATKAKLDAAEGEVDAATKLFQAMRSDLERLNAENKDLQKKNARLRKQSLGLENQIRGAMAVALREAMGLVDPRRRSPRLAEVASKKPAKV